MHSTEKGNVVIGNEKSDKKYAWILRGQSTVIQMCVFFYFFIVRFKCEHEKH